MVQVQVLTMGTRAQPMAPGSFPGSSNRTNRDDARVSARIVQPKLPGGPATRYASDPCQDDEFGMMEFFRCDGMVFKDWAVERMEAHGTTALSWQNKFRG